MARVDGVDALVARLRSRAEQARRDAAKSVIVGYSQSYSIYVHEDLEARHAPPTQAKFLEGPARRLAPELRRIITEAVGRGVPLPQAVLLAALFLQRSSQQECPVKTGALRASAFTRLEG
jgi:hypothetical protein